MNPKDKSTDIEGNDFELEFKITREGGIYTDRFTVRGAELETLGAIEKMLIILNKTRQKIIDNIK